MLSIKKSIVAIGSALLLSSTYAQANDLCTKLPGYWHGSSHLKNQTECELYNGCSHVFSLHVSQESAENYRLKITFSDGLKVRKQELPVSCRDGEIQLPIPDPRYTTSFDCSDENECFFIFDSPRFNAEMIKRS